MPRTGKPAVTRDSAATGSLFSTLATHGLALATALGFWAYLTTWWANATFYSEMNVSLHEIGLGYDDLLPIGATLLFVTGFFAALALVAFGLVYGAARWGIRWSFDVGPDTEVVVSWLVASTVLVLLLLAATTVWVSLVVACLLAAGLYWSIRRPQMPTGEVSYPLRVGVVGLMFLVPMSVTGWALNVAEEASLEFRRCARDLEDLEGWIADLVIWPELVGARNGPPTVESTYLWLLGSDEGVAVLLDRDDGWIYRIPLADIDLVGFTPTVPEDGGTEGSSTGGETRPQCRTTDES